MCQGPQEEFWLMVVGEDVELIQVDKALLADHSIPGIDLFQVYRSWNFCVGVRIYNNLRDYG